MYEYQICVYIRTHQHSRLWDPAGLVRGHPDSNRRACCRPLSRILLRLGRIERSRGPEQAARLVVWWVEGARPCASEATLVSDIPQALGARRRRQREAIAVLVRRRGGRGRTAIAVAGWGAVQQTLRVRRAHDARIMDATTTTATAAATTIPSPSPPPPPPPPPPLPRPVTTGCRRRLAVMARARLPPPLSCSADARSRLFSPVLPCPVLPCPVLSCTVLSWPGLT